MNDMQKFRNVHKGETILLVGNGENLHLTPPEKFPYPSIGMNEIYLYDGWTPDYWVAVDGSAWHENIRTRFLAVPKFIPHPRLTKWQGENFHRFKNLQGFLWPKNGRALWQDASSLETQEWIYANSMHIVIKLAYWMGAKNILIIGMEHRPHKADVHFYGKSSKMSPDQPTADWLKGYKILCDQLSERKVRLINVSQDTFVPADIIPQDSWENWLDDPAHEREEE